MKSVRLSIHGVNPQARMIAQAVSVLQSGGLVVLPTDEGYVMTCHLDDKKALDRMRDVRQLPKNHLFSLMGESLAQLSSFMRIDNWQFRLLKEYLPGPYTFILPATGQMPKRLLQYKRRTLGMRIPKHPVAQALLAALGEPLVVTSLVHWDDDEMQHYDSYEVIESLDGRVELILDLEDTLLQCTSVVDLTQGHIEVLREGLGDVSQWR